MQYDDQQQGQARFQEFSSIPGMTTIGTNFIHNVAVVFMLNISIEIVGVGYIIILVPTENAAMFQSHGDVDRIMNIN